MSALRRADIETMRHLAEAASPETLSFGQMRAEHALDLPAKTAALDGTSADQLWTTWFGPADDSSIVAITGNGKFSEANARFFATARLSVLLLIEEVDRLRAEIDRMSAPSVEEQPAKDGAR